MKFVLNSLRINYYRKIDTFELSDVHDMIVIGPNGAGKSSILMALRDVLYGIPTSNYQYGNEKLTELEVSCEINDIPVHIVRRRGSAYAEINDEKIDTIRDINKQINSMIPKHIFTTLILNSTYFAELSPSEKKDIFDFIIGTQNLDKYTECTKALLDETTSKLSTIAGFQSSLDKQLNDLQNQLKLKQEEYTTALEVEKELVAKIQNLENEISKLQLEEQNMHNKVYSKEQMLTNVHDDKLAHLDSLISTYNDQIDLYNNQLKDLMTKRNQNLTEQTELAKYEKFVADLHAKIAALNAEIQEITNKGLLIKQSYERRIKNEQDNSQKVVLQTRLEDLKKQKEENIIICPHCNKETSKLVLLCQHCKEEIYNKITDIDNSIVTYEQRLQLLEQNTEDHIKKLKEEMEEKLQPLRDKIAKLKQDINGYRNQIGAYNEYIDVLKQTIEEKLAKISEEIKQEQEQIHEKIEELKQKIHDVEQEKQAIVKKQEQSEQELIELKTQLSKLQMKIKDKQLEKDELHAQLKAHNPDSIKQVIDTLKNNIYTLTEQKQQKEKEYDSETQEFNNLTFWHKTFKKELRTALLEDILPTINSELLNISTDFNRIPNIRVYNNEFVVFGDDTHFRDLSTGEKQLCKVLPNIILSKYINSNILFFDEAFDGLDSDNTVKMCNIIKILEPAVIIITHTDIVNYLSDFDVLDLNAGE